MHVIITSRCDHLAYARQIYLPVANRVPLVAPNVEQATKKGMVHDITPRTLLPHVCNATHNIQHLRKIMFTHIRATRSESSSNMDATQNKFWSTHYELQHIIIIRRSATDIICMRGSQPHGKDRVCSVTWWCFLPKQNSSRSRNLVEHGGPRNNHSHYFLDLFLEKQTLVVASTQDLQLESKVNECLLHCKQNV